jgi:hypothetical protein
VSFRQGSHSPARAAGGRHRSRQPRARRPQTVRRPGPSQTLLEPRPHAGDGGGGRDDHQRQHTGRSPGQRGTGCRSPGPQGGSGPIELGAQTGLHGGVLGGRGIGVGPDRLGDCARIFTAAIGLDLLGVALDPFPQTLLRRRRTCGQYGGQFICDAVKVLLDSCGITVNDELEDVVRAGLRGQDASSG